MDVPRQSPPQTINTARRWVSSHAAASWERGFHTWLRGWDLLVSQDIWLQARPEHHETGQGGTNGEGERGDIGQVQSLGLLGC